MLKKESARALKVLIVEDDKAHAYLLSFSAKELGFQVEIVTNLTDAKPLLDWADCIMLDLELPGTQGVATLEEMTTLTKKPIIVVTSHDDETIKRACLAAGASEYIKKGEVWDDLIRIRDRFGKPHKS